jgi:hypothetical protein
MQNYTLIRGEWARGIGKNYGWITIANANKKKLLKLGSWYFQDVIYASFAIGRRNDRLLGLKKRKITGLFPKSKKVSPAPERIRHNLS